MNNPTNCKNCGAPLKYNTGKRIAKCNYCNTEYHMDNLGRLEEYKIEIELFGKRMKFYLNQMEMKHDTIEYTTLCDAKRTYIRSSPTIELNLISCGEVYE